MVWTYKVTVRESGPAVAYTTTKVRESRVVILSALCERDVMIHQFQ
jgi:hypothetical protein